MFIWTEIPVLSGQLLRMFRVQLIEQPVMSLSPLKMSRIGIKRISLKIKENPSMIGLLKIKRS
jgi:hypothetical protein